MERPASSARLSILILLQDRSSHPLYRFHEAQRGRIHAVAKPGRFRTVVENVAEMRVAFGAGNRNPLHADRGVADLAYIFLGQRHPETGPARPRIKLRRRTEERVVAADTAIEAFIVQVPIFPAVSKLGICVTRDPKRSWRKLLAPFLVGLYYPGNLHLSQALAGIGELHNRYDSWL